MAFQAPLPGGALVLTLAGGAFSLLANTTAEARPRSVRGVGRPGVGVGGVGRPGVGVGGVGPAGGTVRRTSRRVARRTTRRVVALGAGASLVYFGGMPYYYWEGSYYEQDGDTYVQVIIE